MLYGLWEDWEMFASYESASSNFIQCMGNNWHEKQIQLFARKDWPLVISQQSLWDVILSVVIGLKTSCLQYNTKYNVL